MEPKNLSDEDLYDQCREYGMLALLYRRKFIGLLPEVSRRSLYEKKGFTSIFEFAFKLGGLSEEQVKRAISLSERFEDRPQLQGLLASGEVSMNKLARVAAIATPENENFWAQQVQNLPQKALEVLVKDERSQENENVLQIESVRAHNLKLCGKVEKQLAELQNKGIDIDALLLEFLEEREAKIAEEKAALASQAATSRALNKRTKNLLKEEHGTKCAIPNCKKPAEQVHHTHRFSLAKNHNPYYLAPLCKQHHQIAHSIDQKVTKHFVPPAHPPRSAS